MTSATRCTARRRKASPTKSIAKRSQWDLVAAAARHRRTAGADAHRHIRHRRPRSAGDRVRCASAGARGDGDHRSTPITAFPITGSRLRRPWSAGCSSCRSSPSGAAPQPDQRPGPTATASGVGDPVPDIAVAVERRDRLNELDESAEQRQAGPAAASAQSAGKRSCRARRVLRRRRCAGPCRSARPARRGGCGITAITKAKTSGSPENAARAARPPVQLGQPHSVTTSLPTALRSRSAAIASPARSSG